jgi:hypothetical protein
VTLLGHSLRTISPPPEKLSGTSKLFPFAQVPSPNRAMSPNQATGTPISNTSAFFDAITPRIASTNDTIIPGSSRSYGQSFV